MGEQKGIALVARFRDYLRRMANAAQSPPGGAGTATSAKADPPRTAGDVAAGATALRTAPVFSDRSAIERLDEIAALLRAQKAMLDKLDGRAMTGDDLARSLGRTQAAELFRQRRGGGIEELRKYGLIAHRRRLGYFRPDRPPLVLSTAIAGA